MPTSTSSIVAHVLRHPEQLVEDACVDALVLTGVDPVHAAATATVWADRVVTESLGFLGESADCLTLLARILRDRGDSGTADAFDQIQRDLSTHLSLLSMDSSSMN